MILNGVKPVVDPKFDDCLKRANGNKILEHFVRSSTSGIPSTSRGVMARCWNCIGLESLLPCGIWSTISFQTAQQQSALIFLLITVPPNPVMCVCVYVFSFVFVSFVFSLSLSLFFAQLFPICGAVPVLSTRVARWLRWGPCLLAGTGSCQRTSANTSCSSGASPATLHSPASGRSQNSARCVRSPPAARE